MDLSDFAARDQITFDIKDPRTMKPIDGFTITAYTSDSAQYQLALERLVKTDGDTVKRGVDLLVALFVSSTAIFQKKQLDADGFRELLLDTRYKWLREQVDRAVHDRARFFGESSGD